MEPTAYLSLCVFYVVLLAGFGWLMPRAQRAQILFGVQVDPAALPAGLADRLRRAWDIRLALIAVAGLFVTWVTRHDPHPGTLIAVLFATLAAQTVIFLTLRRAVLPHAAPPSQLRVAELPVLRYRDIVPPAWEILPAALLLAGLIAMLIYYPQMPSRVPIHFDFAGAPDRWVDKSPAVLLITWLPAFGLYVLLTLLTVWLPRSSRLVSSPSIEQSLAARRRFMVALTRYLFTVKTAAVLILLTALLAIVGSALKWPFEPGRAMPFLAVGIVVLAIGGTIYLTLHFGQGGSRVYPSAGQRLEGAAADERHWRWGLFYVNRDDPALFVEKRFGIGLTMNFGNPRAWWLIGLIAALVAVPILLTVLADA